MKTIYLDTNVILAQWSSQDPHHKDSTVIISAIKKVQINGYFSSFGLVEVAAVIKRQESKFSPTHKPSTNLPLEFVRKVRKIPNMNIFNDSIILNVRISGKPTEILATYWKSLSITTRLGLKTLDTIHLALATIIPKVTGTTMDYFVTGDKEILNKGNEIKKFYDISVVDPSLFIQVEGL